MSEQNDRQRQLAVQLAQNTPPSEREALRMWAGSLLELRQKDMSVARKTKEAILITHRASVTWPILKVVYTQIKKYGWDNRSTPQRLGLGAAGAAFALFGGANAGIAALGGAIGVPLWVVF
ncbi:hypothetical protein C0075_06670 [Rhizobium sp. KAs_5_22]|uniref:hypothetical protein n=1 Tax=Ciceribacter selenitireducens TaxID=448181 RepID=UPI00048BF6CF|nr:hypothetical protein [Ciceribacter selenitireducens]PPJ45437.1 hypothetical protein C0075_06670 [Rhizobium sp. KAs_5_22]